MDSITSAAVAMAMAGMPAGIAHGGRLIEARRDFPAAPAPFIDLSTGINPHAYPVADLPDRVYTQLPEPEQMQALQQTAARAYGVTDAAMVVAAPGTQILISLFPFLLGARTASILGPTYGEHGACWRAACATVVEYTNADRFCACAPGHGGVAVLCNPNNPDGRRLPANRLLALADAMHQAGGLVICDEAFADLEGDDATLAHFLPHDGLLLLRSFGKSYGLAGIRLGFLLAGAPIAARFRIALGPWAVSGPALHLGQAALADVAWRDAMRRTLEIDCHRLDAACIAAGLQLAGGTRLFRLYHTAPLDAAALYRCLASQGILCRVFDHDSSIVRFGLPGSEQEWTRLQHALGCFRMS